jgi:hypothetical protein
VPADPADPTVNSIYPTAIGGPFRYGNGYSLTDSLFPGEAYWVKFADDQSIIVSGWPISDLIINVGQGWNLVGSISATIPVTHVSTVPAGIIESPFYRFDGSYRPADSIIAGKGYWVKVSQSGLLRFQIP